MYPLKVSTKSISGQSSYHPQLCTLHNGYSLVIGPFQKYPALRECLLTETLLANIREMPGIWLASGTNRLKEIQQITEPSSGYFVRNSTEFISMSATVRDNVVLRLYSH